MSDRDLEQYLIGARLSFAVQMPANSFATQADLLNVDTPAWCARAWTLVLKGYQYSQGPVAFPSSPGGSFTRNSDNATSGAGSISVQLTWGVDGVMETALVDYPTHGGCVQLIGGNIRVGLVVSGFSTGNTPPLVGGYLAPVTRSSLGAITNPTYSLNPQTIPNLNFITIPAPRRAVAYRIYQQDVIVTAGDITVLQEDDGANVVQADFPDVTGIMTGSGGGGVPSEYTPLNNRAQYLRVSNANATNPRTVGVVWLLDIG
jgi:hypothetical protein